MRGLRSSLGGLRLRAAPPFSSAASAACCRKNADSLYVSVILRAWRLPSSPDMSATMASSISRRSSSSFAFFLAFSPL